MKATDEERGDLKHEATATPVNYSTRSPGAGQGYISAPAQSAWFTDINGSRTHHMTSHKNAFVFFFFFSNTSSYRRVLGLHGCCHQSHAAVHALMSRQEPH